MSAKTKIPDHPAYRSDIDGLRAVAVLSVVGFHAFPTTFRGGFIGVDIFFVISGFLISSIIFSSLEHSRFSITDFYSRRIRRIFPALLSVIIVAYACGWFILYADEYRQLGKHIVKSAAFVLNFTLWHESGYFDTAAETKPLLHLWSLAVEEQFYIFWPLLLVLVWRGKKKWNFFIFTGLVAAASFLFNAYEAGRNPVADFYSPFTRFWELMSGSLLAYAEQHKLTPLSLRYRNLCSISACILLALGFFFISEARTFPGWWALLPTMSALLFISAEREAWINKKILSHPVLVGIGILSYPLYLWHWPILSFLHITKGEVVTSGERFSAVLLSALLAWGTYRFIEKPIRFGKQSGMKAVILFMLMVVAGATGYVTYQADGLSFRTAAKEGAPFNVSTEKLGYKKCDAPAFINGIHLDYCSYSGAPEKIDAALIGDSHAEDKFNGLAKADKNRSWMLIGNSSCPPVYNISVESDQKDCEAKSEKIIDWISQNNRINTVALSFFGNYFLTTSYAADHIRKHMGPDITKITSRNTSVKSREEMAFYGLDQAVSRLLTAHKKVIVFMDVPELPFSPRDCVRQKLDCKVSAQEAAERQKALKGMLEKLQQQHPDVLVYDPTSLFCGKAYCIFRDQHTVFYHDSHHLAFAGSDMYATHFIAWLNHH